MKTKSPATFLAAIAACVGLVPVPSLSTNVVVDPNTKYQIFEGWGTSLCWWTELAGQWSVANRNKFIDALVNPDTGLGYNCFRYNIGGGDQPSHHHMIAQKAVPGFKPTESGAYDWTADPYQRNIALGIAARCNNPIFEAFSNSPPWWMTVSGCVGGNTNGADNLKSTYFTTFADYLTEVAKHYRDTWGITFRTIEPFNEPSSGWWKVNGGQEGCGFKAQQPRMVKELGKQLVAKGLFTTTKVSSGDENSMASEVSALGGYDDSAFSFMSQVNAHSYAGLSSRGALYSLAVSHKKNLWQSECGPLNKGSDPSDITMWMSNQIIQDLRIMKPNAWIDWQVSDPSANWMLIQADQTNQTIKYMPQFYMRAAFSRFIRPGSQMISSSDANSVAALVPSLGSLVIVLRNGATTSDNYAIDLSKFTNLANTAKIYRYSVGGTLVRQPDLAISGKQLSFTAPAQSITTCVIPQTTAIDGTSPAPTAAGRFGASLIGDRTLQLSGLASGPYGIELINLAGRRVESMYGNAQAPTEKLDLRPDRLANGVYRVGFHQGGTTAYQMIAIPR